MKKADENTNEFNSLQFEYFCKNCTLVELTNLKKAHKILKEESKFSINFQIFSDSLETVKVEQDGNNFFDEEDKKIIFEIIAKDLESKIPLSNIEKFCEEVEKNLLRGNRGLLIEEKGENDIFLDRMDLTYFECSGLKVGDNCLESDEVFLDNREEIGKVEKCKKLILTSIDIVNQSLHNLETLIKKYSKKLKSEKNFTRKGDKIAMDLKHCSGWLSSICVMIQKVVSNKKTDMMHREEIEHKFNILQLEIRTQNEMIKKLQEKNIDLKNELMNIDADRVKFKDLNQQIKSQKKENKKLKRVIAQIKDEYTHKKTRSSTELKALIGESTVKIIEKRTDSYYDKEREIQSLKGEMEDLEQKLAMMVQENNYLTSQEEMRAAKNSEMAQPQKGSVMSRITHNIRSSQVSPLSLKLYNNERDSHRSGTTDEDGNSEDARRVLETDSTVFEHIELGMLREHSARIESQISSRFSGGSVMRRSFVRFSLNPSNPELALKAFGIDLDFNKLTTYKDYLNLASNITFENILKKSQDDDYDGYCFTDHIYILSESMKRSRFKIAITEKFIFLLKGKKKLTLTKKFRLDSLKQVSVSSKNHTLALLTFKNEENILIDSYRRVDIILYILLRMKKAKFPNFFKIVFLRNFKFSSSNSPEQIKMDKKLKSNQSKLLLLQETFKFAKKSGYLKMRKRKLSNFLKKDFCEYFFLLSNIGLIYFKSFGIGKASGFIPFLGSTINEVAFETYKKDCVFSIDFSGKEFIFQASSFEDREEWVREMRKSQEDAMSYFGEDSFERAKDMLKKSRIDF